MKAFRIYERIIIDDNPKHCHRTCELREKDTRGEFCVFSNGFYLQKTCSHKEPERCFLCIDYTNKHKDLFAWLPENINN